MTYRDVRADNYRHRGQVLQPVIRGHALAYVQTPVRLIDQRVLQAAGGSSAFQPALECGATAFRGLIIGQTGVVTGAHVGEHRTRRVLQLRFGVQGTGGGVVYSPGGTFEMGIRIEWGTQLAPKVVAVSSEVVQAPRELGRVAGAKTGGEFRRTTGQAMQVVFQQSAKQSAVDLRRIWETDRALNRRASLPG